MLVTITVTPVNDAPTAAADSYAVQEDGVLNVAVADGVLDNDADIDDSIFTARLEVGPTNGQLDLHADGSFVYTPNADFAGVDQFTYRAADFTLTSDVQTVQITVSDVADNPVADNDTFNYTASSGSQLLDVLLNDSDPDAGDTITLQSVSAGSNGGNIVVSGNRVAYTPAAGFTGTESFVYTIIDSTSRSDSASVSITVPDQTTDGENSIRGSVYLDVNDDGARDAAETGVPGVLITLSGTTSGGSAVERTQLTANDGSYLFAELPNGTYSLSERQPTALTDGNESSDDSDAVVGDDSITELVVTGGESLANNNFGELAIQSSFINIAWFFASSSEIDKIMRETVAVGEEQAGEMELAAAIRAGESDAPDVHNTAPIAVNDTYQVASDQQLDASATNGVLSNDTDPDGDLLTATLVQQATNGTVTLEADGSFSYQPDAGYAGPDTFTYRASDGTISSSLAVVTITVGTVVDNAPNATADDYSIEQGSVLTVDATAGVLSNDSDPDGDSLTAQLVNNVSNGTLVLSNDGGFTYTPNASFTGSDSFSYRANDGELSSTAVTVAIEVVDTNAPPTAVADTYTTDEDTPLVVNAASGLLDNDTDVDDDVLIVQLVTSVSHGALNLNDDGSFTYTPEANFTGSDSFTYRASDGIEASQPATVTIAISAINDSPVAANDAYSLTEGGTLSVDAAGGVLFNDTDADNAKSELSVTLGTDVAHGTLTLNSDGSFGYAPETTFHGTDEFTYTVSDGVATSAPATVTLVVNPLNAGAPTGQADEYRLGVNETLSIDVANGVLANDSDPDSDTLTASLITNASNGTVNLNGDGSFTYLPNTDYRGEDAFVYEASDGELTTGQVSVVLLVNSLPVAVGDNYSFEEDTVLQVGASLGLLKNDTDADDDVLVPSITVQPSHGTVTLSINGSFEYEPDADFTGTDSFQYRVNDGLADSNEVTVSLTVTAADDAPVANDDAYTMDEDNVITVGSEQGILLNDNDVDGDSLTATLVDDVSNGTLVLTTGGTFTYTPDAHFSGFDSFTYRASDGTNDSDVATVTITVAPINDAPVPMDDSYTLDQGSTATIDAASGVLANDTDVDVGDTLTASVVDDAHHGSLSLNGDGSFTYTPDATFTGSDTFTYRVNDGTVDSDPVTVTLQVDSVNSFSVSADATVDTLVGSVTAPGLPGTATLYQWDSASLDSRLQLSIDDHVSGDPAAPLVLIEYLDFQCPVCASYHPVVESLEQQFDGELLVVRRHLPLTTIHSNARAAAIAAEAAGRQGQFEEFGRLLFNNQVGWESEADPVPFFVSYAAALGLNVTEFNNDMADPTLADRVDADATTAFDLGATGTPTFFVDGQRLTSLPGPVNFPSTIQEHIDNIDDVFALNRDTGEIFVRDAAALTTATDFSLNVIVTDAAGTSLTYPISINVSPAPGDSPVPPATNRLTDVDQAFADQQSWAP